MTVSRTEFGDRNPQAAAPRLSLRIIAGQLPSGLQGHVFVVGPAGSVNSPRLPNGETIPCKDGMTLLYNGDGMIFRFDFNQLKNGAFMAARLIKTPCYYADAATHKDPKFHGSDTFPDLRFQNIGVARLGKLGARNQLNTAFVPMKFAHEDRPRLLVTWDAGRPYEIDPDSLETVTPVGWNHEWEPANKLKDVSRHPPVAFPTVQTSAHPVFDPHRNGGELITVNLGRSISSAFSQLLSISHLLNNLKNKATSKSITDGKQTASIVKQVKKLLKTQLDKSAISALGKAFLNKLKAFFGTICNFEVLSFSFSTGDFVDLIIWDGMGTLKKWRLTDNEKPIKINQSIHQIGITEDYVVLLDTAFKVSTALFSIGFFRLCRALEALLPPFQKLDSQRIEKVLRDLLKRPQLSDNHLYIIRRSDLTDASPNEKIKKVNVQKISLPFEAAHFLVDYQNPDDIITIHFSHVCAWDAAECINKFDYDLSDDDNSAETAFKHLYGIISNPADLSRLGCATLKITTQSVEKMRTKTTDIVMDPELTWGPAIYAYRLGNQYGPPKRINDLYWGCIGSWRELLKPHIEGIYQDYPYREIEQERVREIAEEGCASNLLRLHITPIEAAEPDQSRVRIADIYKFRKDIVVSSPQFIPAQGSNNVTGSTDGFIFCIIHYGDGSKTDNHAQTNGNEIWIFDAADLSKGPLCQLYHPQMNLGFTVHSTWLQTAQPRTANYNIPIETDYQSILTNPNQYPEIRELFKDWVFKQQENKTQ